MEDNTVYRWVKAEERLPTRKGSFITRYPTLNRKDHIIKECVYNPMLENEWWTSVCQEIEWLEEIPSSSLISGVLDKAVKERDILREIVSCVPIGEPFNNVYMTGFDEAVAKLQSFLLSLKEGEPEAGNNSEQNKN